MKTTMHIEHIALKTELIKFLRENYPDEAEALTPLLRPCIRMKTVSVHSGKKLTSKFGGSPDVTSGFKWPYDPDGTPLSFLFQLRLEEIAHFPINENIPKSGMLYFFVLVGKPEHYPEKAGEYRVIYDPEISVHTSLNGAGVENTAPRFPVCSVTFHFSYSFPCYQDYEILQVERETGLDLFDAAGQTLEYLNEITGFERLPDHKLFGGADAAQGTVVFHWARIRLGKHYPFNEADLETIGKQEKFWKLLLQVDFTDSLLAANDNSGGLGGLGYFGIEKDALDKQDFDSCLLIFQDT